MVSWIDWKLTYENCLKKINILCQSAWFAENQTSAFHFDSPNKKDILQWHRFWKLNIVQKKIKLILRKRTAATRDRTKDLQIFSLTLSQLSYHGTYKIWCECKHFVNESRLRCNQNYFEHRVPGSISIFILYDVYDMSVWKYIIIVMNNCYSILTFQKYLYLSYYNIVLKV